MENNYLALLANDVKKLWNGLDDGQKLGMLALIVVTIIAATFFLSKAMIFHNLDRVFLLHEQNH